MPSDQHSANHIHNLDQEHEVPIPCLHDIQQDRLNLIFDENARDTVFGNGVALFRDGVLVGDQCG